MLSNPKKDTEFRYHNNRLCLFHKSADHLDYWKDYWAEGTTINGSVASNSSFYEFDALFNKYILPTKDQIILEAGCGAGVYVNAFYNRGNKVIGIDYEPQVISNLKRNFPHVDYRHGNILDMEFSDESIGYYISLGVLEHFEDTSMQSKAFEEAYRVLGKGGLAFISVPYLNAARTRHLEHVKNRKQSDHQYSFHQYYYSKPEFSELLRQHGFEVIETFGYSCQAFINRELPLFKWGSKKMPWSVRNVMNRFLKNTRSDFIRNKYAHMMMYVCRK